MDKFKKSGENVVNFIVDSLKGDKPTSFVNGKLPILPEMRTLTNSVKNIPQNWSFGPVKTLLKILGVLLLLFVIYKILEMTNFQSIFGAVEKEIKAVKKNVLNPMFDVSNNLNSNEILDFLLGTQKNTSEWCFVGESKGNRVCTLSQGNQCMSGSIFPTQNICINPKLKG